MNAKLHPREFAYILNHAGMRLCFASPSLYPGIRGELPADEIHLLAAEAALLEEMAGEAPMPPHPGEATDPAWLFYTSGTTGRPKGATLTQRNLLFMTYAYYADINPVDERDTIVHAAPLSHGSGLYALAHIAKASHNVITPAASFTPAEMFEMIERYPYVSFFAAPTKVARLLADARAAHAQLANLKTITYGGASMYFVGPGTGAAAVRATPVEHLSA